MRKGILLLTLLLLATFSPASAQPVDSPFLRMLARIPDTPTARESFTYADYRALVAARPGAPVVTSWAAFEALDDEGQALYISGMQGLNSGPETFARYFMQAAEMPPVIGFDLLQVERGASYGIPPETVILLEGDFDRSAILTAHEARGYTKTQEGDFTLLCGAEGCENGMKTNLRDRNTANIFGGDLGRRQPMILGQRFVASSPSIDALNLLTESMNGDSRSLAEQPDYRAAAEAITADGPLLQAYFISPTEIMPASAAIGMDTRLSAEQRQALLDQLETGFEPMLQYNLIALADTLTGDEQTTIVALVYTTRDYAETTAALFPERLEQAQSLRTMTPFGDLLEERGVTSTDVAVFDASSDRSVLTIRFHSPLPNAELVEDQPVRSISLVYSLLVRAYVTRDLGWLATQF